jgi:hypothetical protein
MTDPHRNYVPTTVAAARAALKPWGAKTVRP